MRTKPWQVIDVMTNETLGWYATEVDAIKAHISDPVSIIYRPGRKTTKKKGFPYNG